MKKLIAVFLVIAALLTGCAGDVQYKLEGVTIVSKTETEYPCRGRCHYYFVTVEKDGNPLTFKTTPSSYRLIAEGSKYDMELRYGGNMSSDYVVFFPVGITPAK